MNLNHVHGTIQVMKSLFNGEVVRHREEWKKVLVIKRGPRNSKAIITLGNRIGSRGIFMGKRNVV